MQKKEKDNYLHPSRKPTILPNQEGRKTFHKKYIRHTRRNICVCGPKYMCVWT